MNFGPAKGFSQHYLEKVAINSRNGHHRIYDDAHQVRFRDMQEQFNSIQNFRLVIDVERKFSQWGVTIEEARIIRDADITGKA